MLPITMIHLDMNNEITRQSREGFIISGETYLYDIFRLKAVRSLMNKEVTVYEV